ncbi:triadin isoform X2 [Nerophis ophidion]|uniref:triadin isoform X2 n=1 Tax=Nerophis ophidion TaxID=159077 RepID=UPI002ADFE2DB|nr:triadin isoform X2 [Nerophis ophidion]
MKDLYACFYGNSVLPEPLKRRMASQASCKSNKSKPCSPTSSSEGMAPPPRANKKTIVDDIILTFSSPMAWLLVVALVITWSAVAVVLFDLLDYKTIAEYTSYCDDPVCLSPGLPPPPAIAKRGGVRPLRSPVSELATPPESTDWLEMMWTFAVSLVAPDDDDVESVEVFLFPLCGRSCETCTAASHFPQRIFNLHLGSWMALGDSTSWLHD